MCAGSVTRRPPTHVVEARSIIAAPFGAIAHSALVAFV
jgi:hypothetical protein